jgi:hypothetical protein
MLRLDELVSSSQIVGLPSEPRRELVGEACPTFFPAVSQALKEVTSAMVP